MDSQWLKELGFEPISKYPELEKYEVRHKDGIFVKTISFKHYETIDKTKCSLEYHYLLIDTNYSIKSNNGIIRVYFGSFVTNVLNKLMFEKEQIVYNGRVHSYDFFESLITNLSMSLIGLGFEETYETLQINLRHIIQYQYKHLFNEN